MIRMIDIVFILLFGFIAVSQISSATIEPPKSSEVTESAPEGTEILILAVHRDGRYSTDELPDGFTGTRQLTAYLGQKARALAGEGKKFGVRIRSDFDAPIEFSLRAAKVCRELDIPKGLDVIKVREK